MSESDFRIAVEITKLNDECVRLRADVLSLRAVLENIVSAGPRNGPFVEKSDLYESMAQHRKEIAQAALSVMDIKPERE